MDNLYILLVIAGVLVLLVVAIMGFWQARKARQMQQVKTGYALPANDLAASFGIEPVLGKEAFQDQAASSDPVLPHNGSEPSKMEALPSQAQTLGQYACMIDPLVDTIVVLDLERPVLGGTALAAATTTRRVGSKPMYFEGFNAKTGLWETLQSAQMYNRIQVGLQIASRSGALNEIEFSDFIMKMNNYADALNASFEAPDMVDTVSRARALDEFACEHDIQLHLHLVANKVAWSPSYVQQQAAMLGFVAGSIPGRLVVPAMQAGAPPVLTLQYDMQAAMADDPNMMPISDVVLSLDVPQTNRLEQPFKLMYKVASTLSRNMEAAIVDEQGTPLNAQGFDAIYDMLEKLYDELEQQELPAGSLAARRLFS